MNNFYEKLGAVNFFKLDVLKVLPNSPEIIEDFQFYKGLEKVIVQNILED